MTGDTYPAPAHGWTCFHCGETFTTPGSARDHFGADPSAQPGCIVRVQVGQERGLLVALRQAEALIAELRAANEQMDHEVGGYHANQRDLQRYFGANSVFGAFLELDSMKGRVLAAEAIVKAAEKIAPSVVAQALDEVCKPKTESATS